MFYSWDRSCSGEYSLCCPYKCCCAFTVEQKCTVKRNHKVTMLLKRLPFTHGLSSSAPSHRRGSASHTMHFRSITIKPCRSAAQAAAASEDPASGELHSNSAQYQSFLHWKSSDPSFSIVEQTRSVSERCLLSHSNYADKTFALSGVPEVIANSIEIR